MDIDGGAYLWTYGSLGSSCNLFIRLEFNYIYIMKLFAINCGPGLHMRCGDASPSWSQLSKESLVVPHASPSYWKDTNSSRTLKGKRKLLFLFEVRLLIVVIVS